MLIGLQRYKQVGQTIRLYNDSVCRNNSGSGSGCAVLTQGKKEEKLTPGTNFSRHERASFIPATFKMLHICPPVQRRHPLPSCGGKTMLSYLRSLGSMWPPSLTIESVLRCVRAGHRHAGTLRGWMDGRRAGRDAGAGGRRFCCVRFSLGHCRVCC